MCKIQKYVQDVKISKKVLKGALNLIVSRLFVLTMKIYNKVLKKDIVIKKPIKVNRAIPIVNDDNISKWYSHQFLNGGHETNF